MAAELQLAYASPTAVQTHLHLVAGGGLSVTVRGRSHVCRARLVAERSAGRRAALQLDGLRPGAVPPGPVLLTYQHAGVEYRFLSELGACGPGGCVTIPAPRRILRRDQRLDRRISCLRQSGFSARLRWPGGEAEGRLLDVSAHGVRVGQLAAAPPVEAWLELQPTLAGVRGAPRRAQVRHRRSAAEGLVVGLQLTGQGFCDDPLLQDVLRKLLQAPLGPSRSLD